MKLIINTLNKINNAMNNGMTLCVNELLSTCCVAKCPKNTNSAKVVFSKKISK